jgi:acyl-CoA reductase-like NAD-dependent aldehyde dehydrogenase
MTPDVSEQVRSHWIGGEPAASDGGEWMESVDPSTGTLIARVPRGTAGDVDRAVADGRRAQREWAATGVHARSGLLHRFAASVREHREELAHLDALDSGNPIVEMRKDVDYGAGSLSYFAGLGMEVQGRTIPASPGNLHYTVREPFGVIGRILPYNHPALFMCAKIAAPLAAGNAVVVKPADQTPLSSLRIAELASGILPPGLVNVVTGDGQTTGRALVQHPEIRRIAFTGGVDTGRAILRDAADGIKEVTLELGGKNPMIVLPDARVTDAVHAAITGMNFHISAGQSCGSNSRILLHESVYDEFVELLVSTVEKIQLGIAVDDATEMGPLITGRHRDRVVGYIEGALREGATQLTDGLVADRLRGGFFVRPTVFADVTPNMAIANEEIFGPVTAVMKWSDEDEMIAIANAVPYGLTANIWTEGLTAAHRLASRVEAGYVWINGDGRHYTGTPWGGNKLSGLGREESLEEILTFTREKTVHTILA